MLIGADKIDISGRKAKIDKNLAKFDVNEMDERMSLKKRSGIILMGTGLKKDNQELSIKIS